MEEGSFRCDANVSIRPKGQNEFGTRTELKNMNSFRNVQRALEYEIKRQQYLVENGETVSRKHDCGTTRRAQPIPCAARKKRMTTVISPIPI